MSGINSDGEKLLKKNVITAVKSLLRKADLENHELLFSFMENASLGQS